MKSFFYKDNRGVWMRLDCPCNLLPKDGGEGEGAEGA